MEMGVFYKQMSSQKKEREKDHTSVRYWKMEIQQNV